MMQSGEERRQSIDQMMWQVPALSLAAQSFLLTISLGNSAGAARAVSGLLAFVASLATIQLLLKHRYFELEWSYWLERLSARKPWADMHDPALRRQVAWGDRPSRQHPWLEAPQAASPPMIALRRARGLVVRVSSVGVWVATLLTFATADLGATVYGVVRLLGA